MNALIFVLLLLSALGSGLMAGVFFAFSNFVMAALARLAPAEGIRAMQAINVTVLNRLFLATFLGTGVTSVAAMVIAAVWRRGDPGTLYCLMAGALYLIGSILVTMRGNVPLNNALAALDPTHPESATRWSDYVHNWTRWNHVRTIACAVATALFIFALSQ
jgi:uncharacterized membrane protein